ncbi:MAG: LPS assembly protein LptD [Steroidobacteraceae bacterium]
MRLFPAAVLFVCAALPGTPALHAQQAAPAERPVAESPRVCPLPTGAVTAQVRRPPPDPARTEPAAPAEIDISSDNAVLGVDGNATLSGDVRVTQGDRELRAGSVEYDARRNAFSVKGAVEYRDPLVRARGLSGDYAQSEGANFSGAEFELPQRPARGTAEQMHVGLDGVIELQRVTFTTCPRDDASWQIEARDISLDTQRRTGSGRSAQIQFKGVPILYLPYISFPLGSERKSGFLFPNVGHTTRSGAQLTVPWYWNARPNIDVTLEPTLYQRRGLDFGGEARWLFERQVGALRVNLLPGDDLAGIDRTRLRLDHRADFADNWRLRIAAEDVSDAGWFEDFAQGPEGTSIAFLERLAEVTYRDEFWRLRGEFQQYQTIDSGLAPEERPYARLPRLLANGAFNFGPNGLMSLGIESEIVNFDRPVGVTGWRLDAAPTVGLDLRGPGFYLRPSAGYRYTRYALDDTAPGTDDAPTRSMPFAALDAGLVFEREAGTHGQRRVTLEPRLLYLYTPYRDQDALPIFDTARPDLNIVQLFSTNRFVGADRVGDANQVSVGVTTRLFDGRTQGQFLAATFGQTFYFETPRVVLPGEPPSTRRRSDVVAQLALAPYRNWSVDMGLQWNPQSRDHERSQVRVQYRPDAERVLNFAYRFQRERLEQGEVSGAWPIGQRWNLFARMVYDLQDNQSLERFAGIEYKACCWRLRAVARRFVSSRTGERDTGIYLQLELNGLASVGTPADAFLERAIRGYTSSGLTY